MNYKKEIARKGLFRILPSDKVLDDRILLYRAIIDRFLLDTVNKDATLADEARRWFSMDNKLFFEVCDYADIEHDFAITHIKKAYKLMKEQKDD